LFSNVRRLTAFHTQQSRPIPGRRTATHQKRIEWAANGDGEVTSAVSLPLSLPKDEKEI
jgi:hypothetical protein